MQNNIKYQVRVGGSQTIDDFGNFLRKLYQVMISTI